MLKKALFAAVCTSFIASFTSAKMTFDHSIAPNFPSFEKPYTAKIIGADYYYNNGNPMVAISLYNPPTTNVYLELSENDLPFGMAIASSVGKGLTLYFANANYDIEELRIEPEWLSFEKNSNPQKKYFKHSL